MLCGCVFQALASPWRLPAACGTRQHGQGSTAPTVPPAQQGLHCWAHSCSNSSSTHVTHPDHLQSRHPSLCVVAKQLLRMSRMLCPCCCLQAAGNGCTLQQPAAHHAVPILGCCSHGPHCPTTVYHCGEARPPSAQITHGPVLHGTVGPFQPDLRCMLLWDILILPFSGLL
jgi:hypothetical protein